MQESLMTTLSIIGNGNMGQAITAVAQRANTEVQVPGHSDGDVALTGDIVVLAVPHTALGEIIETRAETHAGKVIVDPNNPVDFSTLATLLIPADPSTTAALDRKKD